MKPEQIFFWTGIGVIECVTNVREILFNCVVAAFRAIKPDAVLRSLVVISCRPVGARRAIIPRLWRVMVAAN
jgi:hypothetical protein